MDLDLSVLNPAQRDAVTSTEGPLLVLAGAGSGKTRVLTYRVAHLVGDVGVPTHAILAITFTNKAAEEMRGRLSELIGPASRSMWVMTFHAFCVRVLRREAESLGYSRTFTIYDEDDRKRMLGAVIVGLGIDPKRFPVSTFVGRISSAKNELVGPEEYTSRASTPPEKLTAKVFADYERRMRDANAMDFDDLLVNAVRVLEQDAGALERWRARFSHILVDEYQDTNRAQYVIIQMLAATHRNLMVVGDDDQSVYSWRGADIRNILDFEKDYPEATVVKLEQNYRSTSSRSSPTTRTASPRRSGRPTSRARPSRATWPATSATRCASSWTRSSGCSPLNAARTRTSPSSTAPTRSRACSRTSSYAPACPTSSSGARASSSAPRSAT
jgi:DNA helicase-2/ATP-dependent DNA helicase PcrA